MFMTCMSPLSGDAAMPSNPINFWLPYPNGISAYCAQGAMSNFTHKDTYAWDFVLPSNTHIVSARAGRVVFIRDDSTATGTNKFSLANMVLVDLGGGQFATYQHHRQGTARVRLGDMVGVGTQLAEVGSSGTISPHLHFDMRGGDWKTSHDVRFIGQQIQSIEIVAGKNYLSGTEECVPAAQESFTESVLDGLEFLANGIRLVQGRPAYFLPVESEIIFRGSVIKQAEYVFFYLWKMNRSGVTLSLRTTVDRKGEFLLKLHIRRKFTGCYGYMLTARNRSGPALLPAWVH
jgi:murein DD-endopeptidase MepM/ murein hydrolase activator NlpD